MAGSTVQIVPAERADMKVRQDIMMAWPTMTISSVL